ncbi:type IV pilus modification PilV family protein [Ramlibacter sp.]|uniref:type IV pilus modification PilV family protein n=1 Tax=Ramlibacter sp. TaxID=1917967 RepID=UPI003D10205A
MKRRPPPPKRAARGIALIEVLVGILIFSIGILGLIGLQTAMTRAQGTSKMRSEAALAANEIVGALWADRANMALYTNTGGSSTCASTPRCDEWVKKVAARLPGGVGTITTTADGTVTVSVSWVTSAEGTHTYATLTTIR